MEEKKLVIGPISSVDELHSAVSSFSETKPGHFLLFRGQNNLHMTLRSRLSRPDVRFEPDVDRGLSAIAGSILGHDAVTPRNIPFRKAVLQHYGYKTHYIDVTSDPVVAAWFASNQFEPRPILYGGALIRRIEQIRYTRRTDGIGFVLVLAISNAEELKTSRRLFDISTLDPFLRPTRQKAWLLYDRKPLLPDPNDFWDATISIDCSKFIADLTSNYLFPLPNEDVGYRALLNIPFVEVPGALLRDEPEPNPPRGRISDFDLGMRALPVPEYVHSETGDEYDHKWSDSALTEPGPMKLWVKWNFDLESEFSDIHGNIRGTTKVTLSPRARSILYEPPGEIPLRWPDLGTDELFFTFSQFGFDKVYDIEYLYHGVWLHRDKDLIFEHPMTSDEKSLNVHSGHVFEFVGGEILRQNLPSSCPCDAPDSHESRVCAMLRLSWLIEADYLVLVPHPVRIPNWYFVI